LQLFVSPDQAFQDEVANKGSFNLDRAAVLIAVQLKRESRGFRNEILQFLLRTSERARDSVALVRSRGER
jgi:hypothetical protein